MPTAPDIAVQLRFYIEGMDVQPSEAEAAAWFAAHPDRRSGVQSQEGTISVSAGGQTAELSDLLTALVPSACFDAVATLLDTGSATIDLFNYIGSFTLRDIGDEVELAGDLLTTVRGPKQALLDALLECGERWLDLAGTIWADDYTAAAILPALQQSAAAARSKLSAAFA